jgi:hypothetical protein
MRGQEEMRSIRKPILLVLSLFMMGLFGSNNIKELFSVEEDPSDYTVKDIEELTEYILPEDTTIVSLNVQYKNKSIQHAYIHLRIHPDSINEFTENFPEERELKGLTIFSKGLINWFKLNLEEVRIYAYYEERYKSIKYTSIKPGDIILIIDSNGGYYDVYINKDRGDERPTTKPWGRGERKPIRGLIK